MIDSGSGADQIDLSEVVQAVDTVMLDITSSALGFDTIYGFVQGLGGDVIDISSIFSSAAKLFPLVPLNKAPAAPPEATRNNCNNIHFLFCIEH